ncbi:MAG: hypothetical protein IJY09_01020 [Lachnospiraceae bacterium]|nr:hypothetical protein [Lachnospiraceae bacterium]
MGERFVIGEYAFETKAEWEAAKKEEESISYIRAKMDLTSRDAVEKLYRKLIEKRNFITPIGIDFLKEQRSFLLRSGYTEEQLPAIYISLPRKKSALTEELTAGEKQKYKRLAEYYQGKLRNTRIVAVFLVAVVIAMFLITMFGPNTPLADAQERVENRYASWAEELTKREQNIREREKELGITSDIIN